MGTIQHGVSSSEYKTYNPHLRQQFGSMKYATTASSNGLDRLDHTAQPQISQLPLQVHQSVNQPKIRLGSSSLQQNQFSTLQNHNRQYNRQKYPQPTTPTKYNQASYYNSIRKPTNDKQQQWTVYNANDASHYATLPKGARNARL